MGSREWGHRPTEAADAWCRCGWSVLHADRATDGRRPHDASVRSRCPARESVVRLPQLAVGLRKPALAVRTLRGRLRQPDGESRAGLLAAPPLDPTVMQLDDFLRDRQAEAGSRFEGNRRAASRL